MANNKTNGAESQTNNGTFTKEKTIPKCGIVMPISPIDGCNAEHWAEVLHILKDCITSINFEPNLVSDADDIGIIQKRIIQNLYTNEIIVCDVSAKNPNVMFELGMRLAFDKPTIIIKDDKTDYTFDTSVIEHLTYPRDLRFSRIIDFKENLRKKIEGTYKKATTDSNYSTFLKNFGQYKVAHLQEKEVTSDEFFLNSLNDIKSDIAKIKQTTNQLDATNPKLYSQYSRKEYMQHLIDLYAAIKGVNGKELYETKDEIINHLTNHEPLKKMYPSLQDLKVAAEGLLSFY